MYIHSVSNSSGLLWAKASSYTITQKKMGADAVDFIHASKDAKLVKYSPVLETEDQRNDIDNLLPIDLDDLFNIDLGDDATILNFYNKYGDIGLLSHKIKSYITASRWLPTHELSSKSSVLSITPYQSEYFFETNWKKRLKAVSSPIVVDKQRFPDLGKDNDFGVGEYNNEMKKLLGTLVKDPDERLVGQIPKLIFEDHLEFSQFKFNKDFGGFMGTYYPDLVLGMNDSESQLVDFPLPYSIDYFKTYSEPLSEVKKVLKELQSSFSFICAIDEMLVLPERPFVYTDENTAKTHHGKDTILSYLPKLSISLEKKPDFVGYRWGKSWSFKSLLSMFALKMRQQLIK